MRRPIALALIVGAALAGAAGGWFVRGRDVPPPPPPSVAAADSAFAAALDTLDAHVRRARARFERTREPLPDEEGALRRPQTPPYSEHLEMADSLGVGPVTSAVEIDRYAARGLLVPLVDTDLYTVRILEHSAPFVTPGARALLDRIGREFQAALDAEGLPRYRLTVSSATRTPAFQADLRETNRNATGGSSSHEYGVSFDLVYTRWRYAPQAGDSLAEGTPQRAALERLRADRFQALGAEYADRLWGVLTRVLIDVQRSGDALVLLEAEQPVFHITVARRYARPAPAPPPPPDTTAADSLTSDTAAANTAADAPVIPPPPVE